MQDILRLLEQFISALIKDLSQQTFGFLGHVKLLAHDATGRPALVSGTGVKDVFTRGTAGAALVGKAELTVIAAAEDNDSLPTGEQAGDFVETVRAIFFM